MKRYEVIAERRWVQWAFAVLVAAIGVQFTLWVTALLDRREPPVPRPPGVEAFLPIDGMMATRHLLASGEISPVHPAGLAVFLGICLMSMVLARSFCSHVCPVGLISELLGRLGLRVFGRTATPPAWLDWPLRSLKFLVLGFFAWAVWFAMGADEVASFLHSPYAVVVDGRMWAFFAPPGSITVAVVGALVVGSVFVRDLWCRYLCPYGALVGILGLLAPLKVTRDSTLCTDCRECSRVCPGRLPVHRLQRVRSIECTGCQDCVAVCPAGDCLKVRPSRRGPAVRPRVAVALALGAWLVVVGGFRLAGYWETSITDQEYRQRIPEMHSPGYGHP